MKWLSKFLRKPFERLPAKHRAGKNDFDLLVSGVKDYVIIMLGINGRILSWNNGAEKIIGYTAKEAIGKTLEIVYSNEDIHKGTPWQNLEKVKQYGCVEKDGWQIRKDGTGFWASIVCTVLKDRSAAPYGYLIIARDITEIKKEREQLALFSKQIDQSNDSIYTVDANYRITSWNRGAEKLYGYTKEEALGKIPNELLQTEITEQDLSAALKVIDEDGYWSGEFMRITKAGKKIYVHSSTSNIKDADGELKGMIGVSFGITAQKELQLQVNHLATIAEQSTDAINSTDLNRRFTSWNSGCEKLFGYTKEDAMGKTAAALGFINQTADESAAFFRTVMETGYVSADRQFIRKDGSRFYGTATANAVKNDKGEITNLVIIVKDISVRKQLEDELKKSNEELEQKVKERTHEVYKNEKRFRALVENNHSIITLFDQNWVPIYRSPAAERVTGWTAADRNKHSILEQIHPEQRAAMAEIAERALQNPGKRYSFTTRSLHKSGHYLWLEGVLTNMIHDPDVGGIISNLQDITERKNAEEAIYKSGILYRNLFENMFHGFAYCKGIFTDGRLTDFVYLTVNAAYESMTGFYGINGKKVSEVMPGLFESEPAYTEKLSRISLTGAAEKFEAYVAPLDKWYAVSIYSPEHEYFVMLSDDITERRTTEESVRKSEVLYRSLFENLFHGFAYCKGIFEDGVLIDFIYLTVNAEYEAIHRCKNISGKKVSEALPGSLESNLIYGEILGRVAMTGIPEKFETHARPLDKWLAISIYSPGKGYFVILADDISERKQSEQEIIILNTELEERVAKRTEQLKKINDELEAFSYTVSHDLRAPLRGIIGFTSILEEEYVSKLDDEARRITGVIRNNTIRMGHLIDDLLSFSRMGRQDLVKTNFDTGKMVSEVIRESLLPRGNMPKINWVVHSMPAINADINTIRQVWVNLISNAIKYTGKKEHPMIEIGSFLQDNNMVFFIKDNGVGFDEKYRNKLFRVFQRLHNDEDFEGTGIGLAIVEKIISRHDGKVWAQAGVNKGACFYFSLPYIFKIKRNSNNEKSTRHESEFN